MNKKYEEFLKDFNKARHMVLATSINNIVSSRMMSVVEIDGLFYFQTDKKFRKYNELINNPNVSLCIDNIQIEGIVKEMGKPKDSIDFINVFKKHFEGSYKAYSMLEDERLFEVTPSRIERWKYIENTPYIEVFDLTNNEYKLEKYNTNQ